MYISKKHVSRRAVLKGMGVTMALMDPTQALLPFVVGILAGLVAYGRWQLVPLREASPCLVLQPAYR